VRGLEKYSYFYQCSPLPFAAWKGENMSENNLLELIYKETLGIKEQQINTNRRLDKMDERLDGIDERLDKMDERFDGIDERFEGMDKRFDGLTLLVTENSRRLKNIELTLENEITPNIMRVAEAHLDLSRKLDDALKIDREKEMMVLKINILDGEVRRLKERVDCLA
jgi:archaellum component FlaC